MFKYFKQNKIYKIPYKTPFEAYDICFHAYVSILYELIEFETFPCNHILNPETFFYMSSILPKCSNFCGLVRFKI